MTKILTANDIVAQASERTGLSDYGDPAILKDLDRLLDAYNTEAKFTERGQGLAFNALVQAMSVRMQVEDWLKQHPELLDRPVEKPMFVFGLPRTGTTLVINLLASDPARRSFLRWEAFEPSPPPRPEELHAGPRYEKQQAQLDMAAQYMPHISAIHHEDADSPCECQFSMTPSFVSQVNASQAYIPNYNKWFLHEADYGPAFRFHKRFLQMLQHHATGRWTMKNPWHPLFLDALTEVYPDAQLVMTHRDPAEVLGSACSLLKAVRPIYTDHNDPKAIGEDLLETFDVMIQRQFAYREKHGWDAIYDVQYADTLKDPIGVIRGIYQHFGEPLTPAAEQAMDAYMANNKQGKHGKHSYTLEEFGLTREGVHERYADYIERLKIPVKK